MKIKKEIYFDSDIFEEVANRHNIKESIVKDAFNSYISSFKKYIENTDYISYRMPYMGEMLISLSASKREMEKYKRRYLREKDELKKESLKNIYLNYRLKLKKVKIETVKHYFNLKSDVSYKFEKFIKDNVINKPKLLEKLVIEYLKKNNIQID